MRSRNTRQTPQKIDRKENLMITNQSFVSVSHDQVSSDFLDGETVILNLKDGVYYGLNAVGSRIWQLIQEKKSVGEIIETLLDEYDVDPEQCEREVLALLESLSSKGLVNIAEAPPV